MTESKKIIRFELDQTLYQALKENLKEKPEPEKFESQSIIEESNQIEKRRLIKKWKESINKKTMLKKWKQYYLPKEAKNE